MKTKPRDVEVVRTQDPENTKKQRSKTYTTLTQKGRTRYVVTLLHFYYTVAVREEMYPTGWGKNPIQCIITVEVVCR